MKNFHPVLRILVVLTVLTSSFSCKKSDQADDLSLQNGSNVESELEPESGTDTDTDTATATNTDVIISDADQDGIADSVDNCPLEKNPDQLDIDGDGVGLLCDSSPGVHSDEDKVIDREDNCPQLANDDQADADEDGVGDVCDNCSADANSNQFDADEDGLGDVCDATPGIDTDQDGRADVLDNCPLVANTDQANSDEDALGDICDNCPAIFNSKQLDIDEDGIGNVCDATLDFENFESGKHGGGSSLNPYRVSSLLLLNEVRKRSYRVYKLTKDLDLTLETSDVEGTFYNDGAGWTPIKAANITFDGGGHTIRGLTIHSDNPNDSIGLFFGAKDSVLNLGMLDVNITGAFSAGAIFGQTQPGAKIINSFATGVIENTNFGGGLVGYGRGVNITNSYSSVMGVTNFAGICKIDPIGGNCQIKNSFTLSNQTSYRDAEGPYTNVQFVNRDVAEDVATLFSTDHNVYNGAVKWDFAGDENDGTADIWTAIPDSLPVFTPQMPTD